MSEDNFNDKSDEELIADAKSLNALIYQLDCFSSHDILRLDCIISELDKRGYEEVTYIDFVKREEDEEENDIDD